MITVKTFDKSATLNLSPHYTDGRFAKEQTVFGECHKDIEYEYSDRLVQWDYSAHERANKIANEKVTNSNTAAWVEAYLSEYFQRPIEILHIISGVNRSNGYPYNVFGFKYL